MEQSLQCTEFQALCSQLELPPRALFSDVGGDPCQPDAAAADASSFSASITSQLLRLAALATELDALQLGISALTTSEPEEDISPRGRAPGLLIEELLEDDTTAPRLHTDANHAEESLIKAILHVALYGSDEILARPWTNQQTSEAATQLFEVLTSKFMRIIDPLVCLSPPPSSPTLLSAALPPLARSLRPVILAPAEHTRSETSRLEPYAGPDTWERYLAASQLAWVVRHCGTDELTQSAVQLVHQILSAAAIDRSPAVQSCGLWGLHSIVSAANQQIIAPWMDTTAATAQRAVVGCDARAWPAAAALATQIVASSSTEGGAAYKTYATSLFEALLEEGERHSHNAERSIVWLSTIPMALFPVFGLQLTRYFSRLMPLLLEWCVSARKAVRLNALRAVLEAVRVTWPRMPAHAAAIWSVLETTYDDEVRFAGSTSEDILEAVGAAAAGVWACGGESFRADIQEKEKDKADDKGSASLLERVLEIHKVQRST